MTHTTTTTTRPRYVCWVDGCAVAHRTDTGAARCQLAAGPDRRTWDAISTADGRHVGRAIDLMIEHDRHWRS